MNPEVASSQVPGNPQSRNIAAVSDPQSQYTIDLPAFAGPLDLLLHLIDREELDITAISLAKVTEQYLTQIEHLKKNRMEQLIDFLVIGARLVLIKSRALLPHVPEAPGNGEEEEDPAEALIRQLRQYRRFKQAAIWLHEREEHGLRTYLRVAPPLKPQGQLDLSGVSVDTLIDAVRGALRRAEDLQDSVSLVRPRRITIQDQIQRLRHHVRGGSQVRFEELLSSYSSRLEIAVTLLAVLELIKRRELTAVQESMFGPIKLKGLQLE
ncbi:MAG: segregation/condensation protein A [Chloroflexi bacterium]|jgi:segregation and condensation protein A|nr:segregation/condensation protein A [Chloroflexota bacterium]